MGHTKKIVVAEQSFPLQTVSQFCCQPCYFFIDSELKLCYTFLSSQK